MTEIQKIADVGGNKRLSNFEALRLLCMLMVLNLHSFDGWQYGHGVWQALDFFRESTSICAVDCFVLISGYFGIKWKFKSLFNLLFQILFYSVVIYLVAVAIGVIDWSIKDFAERFECFFAADKSWGFAVSYVLLYFCAPLLNALAQTTAPKGLLCYIVVLFIAINFICLPNIVFTYFLVYLVGRYLNRINIMESKMKAGTYYWIMTGAIFLLTYGLLYKALGITNASVVNSLPVGFLGLAYSSPFVIIQAVCLFTVFAKLKINSSIINWCASSSFAIFLIHMHPSIKEIGYYSFTRGLYDYPVLYHIGVLIVLILMVFILSILVDKIRILISDGCFYLISKVKCIIPQSIINRVIQKASN